MRHLSTIGIEPELKSMLKEREGPVPSRHGPHIVVASEPTSKLPLIPDSDALRLTLHTHNRSYCSKVVQIVQQRCHTGGHCTSGRFSGGQFESGDVVTRGSDFSKLIDHS